MRPFRNLSYDNYRKAVLSILDDFNPEERKKLNLAFEVCKELEMPDKRFRLEQTLNVCLWEFDDAIELGFDNWKDKYLVSRSEAIEYHELNREECKTDCKICEIEVRWKQ